MTLWPVTAFATSLGSLASWSGETATTGSAWASGDVVVAVPGVVFVASAGSPAAALAAPSASVAAVFAFSTALPGPLTAGWPVLTLPAGVVVVEAGTSADLGRRSVNHTARNTTAPARRMRIGGEIWLTISRIGTSPAGVEPYGVLARCRRRHRQPHADLGKLRRIDGGGSARERVRGAGGFAGGGAAGGGSGAAGRLGERDHVADRLAPGDDRHDPVDPEREPAV